MPAQAQPQIPVSRISETLLGDAASVEASAVELTTLGTNGGAGPLGDPGIVEPVPEGHVLPMGYRAVRDLAEWASGMRDRQLRFDYRASPDGTSELVTVDLTHAGAPGSVVVPAFTTGKQPPVLYVKLTAPNAQGAVDAVARMADAVFWSESAVEKFLVPYYASCAGSEAVQFLEKLLGAFNTPWLNARVFALLHRAARPTHEPLSLASSVEVVYVDVSVEPNVVGVRGLDDFLGWAVRDLDAQTPPPPGSVPYTVGEITAQQPRYPTYHQLRVIAEWTASIRGTPQYFRYNLVTGFLHSPTATLPPTLENEVVIPACTPYVIAGRLAPSAVWMQPDAPGGPIELSPWADALFLSTGAIEQFLFPYYASKEGAAALPVLQELECAWTLNQPKLEVAQATNVSAVNTGGSVEEVPDGEVTLDEGAEVIVTGLVHLPRSEWVTVTGGGGVQAQVLATTGVVHVDAQGTTRMLPFNQFQDRYGPRTKRAPGR